MAKIENNVPLEGSGNYIDRTSELINDGESGTSRFIEEIELEEAIANIELTPGPQGEQGIPGPVGPVGPKGDIGSTGPPGLKGDKGDRGDIGPQGVPGQKGDTGNTGATGATGLKGDKGDQGPIGPQGDRGIQGPKGDKGDIGPTGLRGLQGDKGDQGPIGFTGQKGDKGDTGPQGIKGDQGIAGYTPIKGIDYFDGAKGDKGDKGNDGAGVTILGTLPNTGSLPSTGNPGDAYLIDGDLWVWNTNTNTWNNVGKIQGPKGDKGDTGTQGIQGVKGNKGDTGATGPKGDKGDKGDQGLIGLTGNTGAKGDTGSQGPKGDKGDQGVQGQQGNPGPSTTISIGNVTTGAPGSSASASMTGVSPNQTLNLVIPQGPAGNPAPVQTLTVGNLMGELSISQGNTVHVNSLQIINKQDANTIPHGNSGGLETWAFNANNATNYPVITGSGGGGGISYFRNGTSGLHSSFDILKMEHSEDKLKFRVGTGTSTKTPWRNFASEDWVINEFSGNFAKIDGSNINPTTWYNLTSGNSLMWGGQTYSTVSSGNPLLFMVYDDDTLVWRPATLADTKTVLGITSQVLNPTLQSVTDNNNVTTNPLDINGAYYNGQKFYYDGLFEFLARSSGAMQKVAVGGLMSSDNSSDEVNIPTNGIYSKGTISTGSHATSKEWYDAFNWGDHAGKYFGRGDKHGMLIDANTAPDGILTGYIWANTPSSDIATLTTIQYSPDWITQTFELINKFNETWVRKRHSGSTWTSWVKIWNYGNLADPATQTWVSNNFLGSTVANNTFVRKAGDIMTGVLNVPSLYSDALTSTNKQLIRPSNNDIYWGNPQITQHIFESTGANSLQHYVAGVGNGVIYTAHNFNPNTKFNIPTGNTSQYIRGDGSLATFPSYSSTAIGANGGNFSTGNINFIGTGNTSVAKSGNNVYINSSGGGSGARTVQNLVLNGGGFVGINERKTRLQLMDTDSYQIDDGKEEGDELVIVGCGSFDVNIDIKYMDHCGNMHDNYGFDTTRPKYFWWDLHQGCWLELI